MGVNILARNIRKERTVAVRIAVKNQTDLLMLRLIAKAAASQIQTKFEGHVKPRQVGSCAETNRRDVVDAVCTFFDNAHDFFEPHLACVVDVACTSCDESEIVNGKYDGLKDRLIAIVERTIEKDVFTAQSNRHALLAQEALSDNGGNSLSNCLSSERTPIWPVLHFWKPVPLYYSI